VDRAAEFLDAALRLTELPEQDIAPGDVHLFHTMVTLKIPADVTLSFDGSPADLHFRSDLDWFNFRELAPGTLFAGVSRHGLVPIEAFDEHGREVTNDYLECRGDEVRLRQLCMPSMLTLDERVIRQDCLGYLMVRLSLHKT
jgi:hypothetical protein